MDRAEGSLRHFLDKVKEWHFNSANLQQDFLLRGTLSFNVNDDQSTTKLLWLPTILSVSYKWSTKFCVRSLEPIAKDIICFYKKRYKLNIVNRFYKNSSCKVWIIKCKLLSTFLTDISCIGIDKLGHPKYLSCLEFENTFWITNYFLTYLYKDCQ